MKLIVVDKNSINNKGITFVLPTIFIKSKVFWKFVYKEKDYQVSVNIFKKLYKQIKKYIRINGHFTLLEVMNDNYLVKVIL
jgi:hypothetical protein